MATSSGLPVVKCVPGEKSVLTSERSVIDLPSSLSAVPLIPDTRNSWKEVRSFLKPTVLALATLWVKVSSWPCFWTEPESAM